MGKILSKPVKLIRRGLGGRLPKGYDQILSGMQKYLEGESGQSVKHTAHTDNPRYCYSVWLRHLVMAHEGGLDSNPGVVAEIGPGSSLGTGLAALLSGAARYYAFEVSDAEFETKNLKILGELIELFRTREPIPDENEFPAVLPLLTSYEFPHHILTDERLEKSLHPIRLKTIAQVLSHDHQDQGTSIRIVYVAPWYDRDMLEPNSVDMSISQAVLEHVDDLPKTYEYLYYWLKPGGLMSNVVDFSCHKMANEWNFHWTYSTVAWRLVQAGRIGFLNRQPHSRHRELMAENGFELILDRMVKDVSGVGRGDLARTFRSISNEDLTTRAAFFQAKKL